MKALVLDGFGSVDNFRLADVPLPEPGPGEVRLRIHASSINSWDWEVAAGVLIARLSAPPKKPARILGGDIAGTVDALGAGVTGFAIGDAVYGDATDSGWGGLAEYACVKAGGVRPMPQGLSFAIASTLPQAGVLAYQAIKRRTLAPGHEVLVIGGGGGVGTFAIQLAKAAGAHVTAIDTAFKAEIMQKVGADVILDRALVDPESMSARYDLVVDPVLRRSVRAQFRMLKPGGDYAVIGGGIWPILKTAALAGAFPGKDGRSAGLVIWNAKGPQLDELAELVLNGTISPFIEKVYPLAQAVDAMQHFAVGNALGKLVVAPIAD